MSNVEVEINQAWQDGLKTYKVALNTDKITYHSLRRIITTTDPDCSFKAQGGPDCSIDNGASPWSSPSSWQQRLLPH